MTWWRCAHDRPPHDAERETSETAADMADAVYVLVDAGLAEVVSAWWRTIEPSHPSKRCKRR